MSDWSFGDMLRYPKDQDPSDPADWAFMFLERRHYSGSGTYDHVLVIRAHWQDDLWEPGQIIMAGVNEFVRLDE